VGLWLLATFGTVFILLVLWIVESFEPRATQLFALCVKAADPMKLKPQLEQLLEQRHLVHELRTMSQEEICYDVHFPLDSKTDHLSAQIMQLDGEAAVRWEEKKEKK